MLFGWCRLGGILGSEGLDKGICWVFCGCDGVFYFGYELWAMSDVRGSVAERGEGLGRGRVHRDPSRSKDALRMTARKGNGEEQTTAKKQIPPLRYGMTNIEHTTARATARANTEILAAPE